MAFFDELDVEQEFLAKRIQISDDDLIMCCCKKHEPHDEGMKFVCLVRDSTDWHIKLFPDRCKGSVIDVQEDESNRHYIPCQVDKRQILGRQHFVHQILIFLTAPTSRDSKRILAINGTKSECGSELAQFAVKYAMDRSHFENGAYYIDCEGKQSEISLIRAICKKVGLFGSGQNDLA